MMDERIQELAQELLTLVEKDEIESVRSFLGEHQFHIGKVVRAQLDTRTLLQHAVCLSSVCVLEELLAVLVPKHLARQEVTRIINDVSVLHVAAKAGRLDVLKMLFDQRIVLPEDLSVTTEQGQTVLQVAHEHQEVVDFITEMMGSSDAKKESDAPQENAEDAVDAVEQIIPVEDEVLVDENENELQLDCNPDARAATLAATRHVSVSDSTKNKITIGDKARTLGRTLLRVLRIRPQEYPLPVGDNYDKAIKKLSKKSPSSVELLGILAYIDCQHGISCSSLLGNQDVKTQDKTIKRVNKYAFVQVQKGEVRLCQEVQEELISKLADEKALSRALTLLVHNLQENANSFIKFTPQLLNHAIKIWNYANKNKDLVKIFTTIPHMICSDIFNNGRIENTINFANENIAILQNFSPDSVDILNLQRILACTLQACGKFKDALALLNTTVSKFEENHPEDEGLLVTLHARANVMVTSGQASSASYDEVITKMRAQMGDQHSATLRCQLDRACALLQQEDLNESLASFTEICEEYTQVFGADDRRTLDARKNHAYALYCAEKYDESLEMYSDIEEILTRNIGEEHVVTLQALVEKADVMLKLSQFDSAIRAYNEVMISLDTQFGTFSPKTLLAKVKLAKAIEISGQTFEDYPTPDKLYNEILNKDYIDKHDPDVLLDLKTRIDALIGIQSNDNEIIEAYERLINMTIEMLGETHPVCCKTQEQLASFFVSRERNHEAENMLLQVLQTRVQILGEEHALTLRALETLADIHYKLSNLDDAMLAYSRLLDLTVSRLGDDNLNTLLMRQKRALTLRKIGDTSMKEADLELNNILEKMKAVLGAEHPRTKSLLKTIEEMKNYISEN